MMTPITATPYVFDGLIGMVVSFLVGGIEQVSHFPAIPLTHSNNYVYISNHLINVQMDQDQ